MYTGFIKKKLSTSSGHIPYSAMSDNQYHLIPGTRSLLKIVGMYAVDRFPPIPGIESKRNHSQLRELGRNPLQPNSWNYFPSSTSCIVAWWNLSNFENRWNSNNVDPFPEIGWNWSRSVQHCGTRMTALNEIKIAFNLKRFIFSQAFNGINIK
jgi:hypothetical protein